MRILAFNPFPSIPSHAQTVRKIGKSDYRKHDVSQMYQGIKGLEPTQLTFTYSKSAIGTLEKRVEYVSDVILVILRSFFFISRDQLHLYGESNANNWKGQTDSNFQEGH